MTMPFVGDVSAELAASSFAGEALLPEIGASLLAEAAAISAAVLASPLLIPAAIAAPIAGALGYASYLTDSGQVVSVVEPAMTDIEIAETTGVRGALLALKAPDVVIPDLTQPQVITPDQTGIYLPAVVPQTTPIATTGGNLPATPQPEPEKKVNIPLAVGSTALAIGTVISGMQANEQVPENLTYTQPQTQVQPKVVVETVTDITPSIGVGEIVKPVVSTTPGITTTPSIVPIPSVVPAVSPSIVPTVTPTVPTNTVQPQQLTDLLGGSAGGGNNNQVNVEVHVHSHNKREHWRF